jgi:hypothetical protein
MSYIILGGCPCDIIVLNVHAPIEEKIDDIKDRFYEELQQVFDKFPNYHMKISLGKFRLRKTFPNKQFEIRVCTKLVKIMKLG